MQADLYIRLLYKQLTGEISLEEKRLLDDWRQQSKENEREAKSVELAWQATAPDKTLLEVNIEDEFSQLSKRIELDENQRPSATTISINRGNAQKVKQYWLAIAASIAVLIVASFFLFQNKDINTGVEWVEVVTQANSRTIVLADQSEIQLNKNSRLKYPAVFLENERRVLLEGEAFFEISSRPHQPFIVETEGEEVKVLGTSFNVSSYLSEGITQLFVATGKVQFFSKISQEKVTLLPGQGAILDQQTGEMSIDQQASTNTMVWLTGQLSFQKSELIAIVNEIEQVFGIRFIVHNPQLATCFLDTSFDVNKVDRFIEDLAVIFGVEIEKINEQEYSIKKGNCE